MTTRSAPRILAATSATAAVAALALALVVAPPAGAAVPPGLGTLDAIAVLAGSTVTNTGISTIGGDVDVSPGTAITGFPPGLLVGGGTQHSADATAAQAQLDLTTAYLEAAGPEPATAVATELGGTTLLPGVYSGATLEITGTLTLDAAGDPSAVFVLRAASTVVTATASDVDLVGGASGCNVFWQVGSSATLGTGSGMVGTVMAQESISAGTGTVVQGRLLARTGAVTLDTTTITRPSCASAPGTTTPTTTTTTPGGTTTTASTTTPTTSGATTPTTTTSATAGIPVGGGTGTGGGRGTGGGGRDGSGGGDRTGGGGTGGGGTGTGGGISTGGGSTATGGSLARTGVDASSTTTLGLFSIGLGVAALAAGTVRGSSRSTGGRHRRS